MLKKAVLSRLVLAATMNASGVFCGLMLLTSIWLFPAANTGSVPRPWTVRTASSTTGIDGQGLPHPQLLLITSAPFSAA